MMLALANSLVSGGSVGPSSPPTLVANLGNSFSKGTVYSDVSWAEEMSALASASGVGSRWTFATQAVDAYNFQNHVTDPDTTAFIASQPWDHAVLQPHSTGMMAANRAATIAAGIVLVGRFIAANPAVKFWIWQTPETPGTALTDPVAGCEEFAAEIVSTYPDTEVEILTQGQGFRTAGADPCTDPILRTWRIDSDDLHPNVDGSAFTTAYHFAMITGRSVDGLLESSAYTALGKSLTNPARLEELAAAWAAGTLTQALTPVLLSPSNNATTHSAPETDGFYWNKISHASDDINNATGSVYPIGGGSLVDRINTASGVTLRIVNGQGASGGASGPTGITGYPGNVSKSYFVTNTGIVSTYRLEGLTPGRSYNLTPDGYRGAGDNRYTRVTFTGSGSPVVVDWNAGNTHAIPTAVAIVADGSGYITFTVENTTPSTTNFGYWGILKIADVP